MSEYVGGERVSRNTYKVPLWTKIFDFTDPIKCLLAMVVLVIPAAIAMIIINAPFQGADEVSHFERAVQISEGKFLPVRAKHEQAAGDYLDSSIDQIAGYYGHLALRPSVKQFGAGLQDTQAVWRTRLSGRKAFTNFSNTVIYFPLAYAVPAGAIAVASNLHLPPIMWLYVGRFANAAAAIAIFAIAVWAYPPVGMFVLTLALLPRVEVGTASMSADATLVPITCLFGALLGRLASRGALSLAGCLVLGFSTFYICVNKIAYMPMCFIPPVVAFMTEGRVGRVTVVLATSSLVTLAMWAFWTFVIRTDVFSIRGSMDIDVYRQLHGIIASPIHFLGVLIRTIWDSKHYFIVSIAGDVLAPASIRIPGVMALVSLALLGATAFLGRKTDPIKALPFIFSLIMCIGSLLAIFLFLYMQYTEVNYKVIDGVQGRYFIPTFCVLAALVGKWRVPQAVISTLCIAIICWSCFTTAFALERMHSRYWASPPVTGLRFVGSHYRNLET